LLFLFRLGVIWGWWEWRGWWVGHHFTLGGHYKTFNSMLMVVIEAGVKLGVMGMETIWQVNCQFSTGAVDVIMAILVRGTTCNFMVMGIAMWDWRTRYTRVYVAVPVIAAG
jgi:hypothetical protein